jgi:hypothetical protein
MLDISGKAATSPTPEPDPITTRATTVSHSTLQQQKSRELLY